jgi:hypothetical protein
MTRLTGKKDYTPYALTGVKASILAMADELKENNDTPKTLMWKIVDSVENCTLADEQNELTDFLADHWEEINDTAELTI